MIRQTFSSRLKFGYQFHLAERQIIDMISAAETFDDAADAARHLYEFCKEEQKKELEVSVLL